MKHLVLITSLLFPVSGLTVETEQGADTDTGSLNPSASGAAEVVILPPMVRVESRYHEPIVAFKGPCSLTDQQKDIAWKNVLEAVAEKYPEHSEYCEILRSHTTKMFVRVNDVCRTFVTCSKTVDGVFLLRGKFRVEVDETTLEVLRFVDIAW